MLLVASFRLNATPISRCGWGGRERQRTEARYVRICAGQLAGEQGDERACGSASGAVAEGEPLPRGPNGEAGRRR
jgi:hypothetical protein